MKKTIIYILVAFIFSLGLRFSYIDNIQNKTQFKDNGEYMINTNDGYTFAKGAKEIIKNSNYINDPKRAKYDNISVDDALSKITAFLVKTTGIKLERIIFYLSAFFSSLVVIPIVLLGFTLGSAELGFIAALLSSIAWSYYNRTMLGYYDTDMLNIVFPAFLLWSLIAAFITKKSIYFLVTGLEIIAYRWWYPQSYSIDFSLITMVGLYLATVAFFHIDYLVDLKLKTLKKAELENTNLFYLSLIIFMLFAINNLPIVVRFFLILALFYAYIKKQELFKKYIWYIFGIGVVAFFITGGFEPIWVQLKAYMFKTDTVAVKDGLNLHFLNVNKTISEASAIPFERVAQRVSGNVIVFVLSIIGYIALLIRHRYFILALPLIALGLLAHTGGLRFTIYAIVPLAFGIAYLIVYIAKLIEENTKNILFYYATLIILSGAILYPNIKHMLEYNKYITPVFLENEVKTLKSLKDKADSKDYILSWWDYGYPLQFYTNLHTLTDGSRHGGSSNYPISYMLIQPQDKSVKMARLAVEYHEKKYALPKDSPDKNRSDIENMIVDNGYKSANEFLSNINSIKLPQKTRDVYLFLPDRMMRIFPVVEQFSNLDIESGKSYPRSLFFVFQNYKKVGDIIYLPYRYSIDLKRGIFNYRGQRVPINKFIITAYNQQGKLLKDEQVYNISSTVNVIYMKSSGRFIILDDNMLNSTYIQLFVLDNYDKNLYKPVISTPFVKIYKLMI